VVLNAPKGLIKFRFSMVGFDERLLELLTWVYFKSLRDCLSCRST